MWISVISLAFDGLRGSTIAFAYVRKLQELRPAICTLSRMAKTVRQLSIRLPAHVLARAELRKLKKDEQKNLVGSSYQWLSSQRRISVAQFVQARKVDHVLCVSRRRHPIWDNKRISALDLIAE